MEEIKEEEKREDRHTTILLILNLIIWTIISFLGFIFINIVNAQTINFQTYNTVDTTDYAYNWGTNYTWHTMNGSIKRFEYVWGNINAGYYEGHITLDLDYTGYYNITKNNITIQCRGSSAVLNCANNIEFSKNVNQSKSLYDIDIYFNGTLDSTQYFQVRIIFDSSYYPPTGIKFRGSGSIDYSQTDNATNTTINNATSQLITNNNNNTSYILEYMNNNKLELEASFTREEPNTTDFNSYENKEEQLYSLVNGADTSNVNINIDTDANSFIWNTITSFLTIDNAIMTLVITVLSIGILKLVLGR